MQNKLDTFTKQYLETALWSTNDDYDTPLSDNYTIDDFSPEALDQASKDCAKFQKDNYNDIQFDFNRAGHDFWLTRNGHGAGFWDGDWPDDVGERLTKASDAFGEVWLYVGDDNKLYFTS